ncbi:MAG: hypothetical protein ACTSW1_07365 [Candidatus Hodarchaeales archaeon]
MTNPKTNILTRLKQGQSIKQIIAKSGHSTKTVYRYARLYRLIKVRDMCNWLIDSDLWELVPAPTLKRVLVDLGKYAETENENILPTGVKPSVKSALWSEGK